MGDSSSRPTSGRLTGVFADPAPLFVYGSLLFPEVTEVLLDRDPRREPVTIAGWRVTALPDQIYPTLVADEASSSDGELLTDLTANEWQTLDAFEHPAYRLAFVEHAAGRAWAYAAVTGSPAAVWAHEHFHQHHLSTYLTRCAAWRSRYKIKTSDQRPT